MSGKIPTYLDRIEQRPMGGGANMPRVSVDAYGRNGNAGLLVRGGHDLIRLGGKLSQFAIERKEREIATDLLADKVAYEDAMRRFESDYKKTHQGVDARNSEQDFDEFHKKRIAELEQKWQGNPHALRAAGYMAENLRSPSMSRAVAYHTQQNELELAAQRKASFAQSVQKWNDPDVPHAEKIKVREAERINARVGAGQQQIVVDGKKEWVGGRNVDAELISIDEAFKEGERKSSQQQLIQMYIENPEAGLALINKAITGQGQSGVYLPPDMAAAIVAEASTQGIDPNLALAVAVQESGGKADAVSPAGALGVMQLMPETAKDLGVDPEDPAQNIKGGVQYLKQLLTRYDGDEELALMAYNGGMGNVDHWRKTGEWKTNGGVVPEETQKYVPSVLARRLGAVESRQLGRLFSAKELHTMKGPMEEAARKQRQEKAIQQYASLPPTEAIRAVIADPVLKTDPQMQRSVAGYFSWKAGIAEHEAKLAKEAGLEAGYAALADIHKRRGTPAEANKLIMSAPIEDQQKLITYGKRLFNGDDLISDPNAFDEVLTRIGREEEFNLRAEYADSLSLKDLQQLENKQLTEYLTREKVEFDQKAREWKSNITQKDINKMFMQFKASIPEGGFKNPEERRKVMDRFWGELVVDKDWALEKTIRGHQEAEYAGKGYVPSRGPAYEELKSAVIARGGRGTDEEVAKLYRELYFNGGAK